MERVAQATGFTDVERGHEFFQVMFLVAASKHVGIKVTHDQAMTTRSSHSRSSNASFRACQKLAGDDGGRYAQTIVNDGR